MTSLRIRSGRRAPRRGQRLRAVGHGLDDGSRARAGRARSRACRRCRRRARCASRTSRQSADRAGCLGTRAAAVRRDGRSSVSGSQRSASSTNDCARRSRVGEARAAPAGDPSAGGPTPNGRRTRNVVPSPEHARRLDRAAVQLHELLHQRQADAGAFVRARRACLRRGGSARTGAAAPSAGTPTPVSPPRARARRARAQAHGTPPSSVNLNAFERRLRTIFSHISRST